MRKAPAFHATLTLLAVAAAAPNDARADEPVDPAETKGIVEGRDALHTTGSALVLGGGLALLPAAYVAGEVAVGAFERGGAERAAKDFQEPIVFAPLAIGFCAIMVGAALLVVVSPPTSTPASAATKRTAFHPLGFTF